MNIYYSSFISTLFFLLFLFYKHLSLTTTANLRYFSTGIFKDRKMENLSEKHLVKLALDFHY